MLQIIEKLSLTMALNQLWWKCSASPQDCISQGQDDVSVVCTEPRRISATSLATRVSQEMGEGQSEAGVKGLDVGEPRAFRNGGPLVGYQIRFESRRGPGTRLVYCTTGVVLRQLQGSADLKGVTHLIIDEVSLHSGQACAKYQARHAH